MACRVHVAAGDFRLGRAAAGDGERSLPAAQGTHLRIVPQRVAGRSSPTDQTADGILHPL